MDKNIRVYIVGGPSPQYPRKTKTSFGLRGGFALKRNPLAGLQPDRVTG